MRIKDLLNEVEDVKHSKPLSKENKDKLRNVLMTVFSVIEKYEKDGSIDSKSNDKIDFLKDTIQSIIKDEEQKKIIKGES